ncbi:MAG: tRNA (cmo5U34)-methyltransferase [Gammaproteobacteria bacterium]|jgi:tRNA (cmo5U34)-methyltransferase
MTIDKKDRVFSIPLKEVKAFEFDENVARVFSDMISRSVPGYKLLLRLITLFADIFVRHDSRVYDLGCSLGEASVVVAEQTRDRRVEIFGIDNAEAMINRCKLLSEWSNINWICNDIRSVQITNASMVILNLTLQFIDPDERQSLIDHVYEGLNEGGALILTEKITSDDEHQQGRMTDLYHAFKKNQGYSDLEISQKRTALENVLISDSDAEQVSRLKRSGFKEVYQYFHCFNFASYLAIK